jgi:eukaryotic-like serine/threonine-protein kinase
MRPQPSPSEGPPLLRPGSVVAPGYEVREHLSRGRALDVYEVWSETRGCLCVVKTLRPDRADDRAARRRLATEGELLLALTHPHVVRAYELVRRPRLALVLETLTGATLAYVVEARARRLPLTELAVLGLQLASALAYLHRHGYLHLDLKPSNVVCDGGLAKLIDLSIARPPGLARRSIGTRPYMAPEQARGSRLTESADVWGLGVVLYEAATGRRPFEGADAEGYPQLRGRADPMRRSRRLPGELAGVVDACLDPEPGARPTIPDVVRVLDDLAPQSSSFS